MKAVIDTPLRSVERLGEDPGRGRINVLLVDDEPRNLDVLETILQAQDLQLVRAQTPEQALMALVQNDFAAIVLDIQMPGMSGFELAKLIKQRKRNQLVPILFLTAYFQDDRDVLSGYGIGAVDYLTKPVNPQVLKSKVNAFVDLFRVTRALALTNGNLELEMARRQAAEEALRRANQELEARVEQRTAALLLANRALHQSEQLYRLILENALEYAVFTVDKHGIVTSWNDGAQRVLGFQAAEILGRRLDITFTAEDRAKGRLESELKRALAGDRAYGEHWRVRKDGTLFWASGLLMAIKDEQGEDRGLLKILRDRTSHKLAEQRLREAEVLHASEREQARISRDLHDGLGQHLAGLSCLCDGLSRDLAALNSPAATTASKISRLLNEAVAQTRSLARGLQPVAHEANGLMSALETMAASVSELFNVVCRLDCPNPVLLEDFNAASHLFRIAQEAVTNASKHAQARHIIIKLESALGRVILTVADDGLGIVDPPHSGAGMGLRIMENRASLIGGQLSIQKRAGGGTEVICIMESAERRPVVPR